jgi:hypothetical protein
MTIPDYIKSIVNEMDSDIFFAHGAASFQNEQDPVDFPLVYLDDPIFSNDVFNLSGYLEETYPVKILFAGKTELDWTTDEHYEVIEPMRVLSRVFLAKVWKDTTNVKAISNIRRFDAINLMDVNVSGIYLLMDLTLFNTNTNC